MNKVEVQQKESTTQNTKFDYINNKCKNTYINKSTHSTKNKMETIHNTFHWNFQTINKTSSKLNYINTYCYFSVCLTSNQVKCFCLRMLYAETKEIYQYR